VRSKEMKKEHIGSDFDDFLREEHLLEISEATAAKRVIARADEVAVRLRRRGSVGGGRGRTPGA
jgi:hypothetical protein